MAIVTGGAKAIQAWGQRQTTKAKFGALAEQREAQNEEIAAKASQSMGERVKQGRAERARLRVAAGEGGVSGQSVNAVMMDAAFQEESDVDRIGTGAKFEQRASEARFKSGLASVKNPGMLETGLGIAVAAAGGYSTGLQIQKAKGII